MTLIIEGFFWRQSLRSSGSLDLRRSNGWGDCGVSYFDTLKGINRGSPWCWGTVSLCLFAPIAEWFSVSPNDPCFFARPSSFFKEVSYVFFVSSHVFFFRSRFSSSISPFFVSVFFFFVIIWLFHDWDSVGWGNSNVAPCGSGEGGWPDRCFW